MANMQLATRYHRSAVAGLLSEPSVAILVGASWCGSWSRVALLCSKADLASRDHILGALEVVLPERRLVSDRKSLAQSGKNPL